MKSQAKFYLITSFMAVAALLAGCATGPSQQAQSNAADRVLSAYEVPDLLAQAAPAVTQSLDRNLPDTVAANARQRLQQAVREAFDPQSLQRDVAERLRERAATDNRQSALVRAADTLDQPLPQRMIALESTTGEPGFAEGFEAFASQPATDGRKQRLRQIDSLTQSMQIIDLQTEFNATLLETMIRARNAAVDESNQVGESRIEQMVGESRQNIDSQLQQRVPLMLLYVYRDVSDAKLAEYAQLQGSQDMAWVNEALKASIIDALDAAGDRLVENYNTGA